MEKIKDTKHMYLKSAAGGILFLAGILPILICSGGVYLWSGDYNDQNMQTTPSEYTS